MVAEPRPRVRIALRRVFTLLVLFGVAAVAFWAGRVTLQPAPVASELPASAVLTEVTEQRVGRELNLNVTVSQPRQALASNTLTGVVTSVASDGTVGQGDVLYAVAGTPVRAVQGSTPFYRPLAVGAKGADVKQLEDALVALGWLRAADTTFTAATAEAVGAWQARLGVERSGKVALGELVAMPKLPSAVTLDREVIAPGLMLSGGEKVVFGASGEPQFALVLDQQQARLVPESATVALYYQGHQWQAVVTGSEQTANAETRLHLRAPDGGPVCGADCGVVAAGTDVYILSKVAVNRPASGPAVPVAAIVTGVDGIAHVTVVDAAGQRAERAVRVLGSQDGVAIVEGVAVGERVQVLAATDSRPNPTASR